jgi:hypothetical protein
MAYAQGTEVSVERTQAELSTLLRKRGAPSVAVGQTAAAGVIQFELEDRQIRFTVPMPDPARLQHTKTGAQRTEAQLRNALAAEERRRWRALLLVVKAKFEAVESEIVTFESEFLAQTVMPDNQTVLEHVREPIARAYVEGHVRPLLELGA